MSDTIKQRSRTVSIRDATGTRSIHARRMRWKAAKTFYADLAKVVAALFTPRSNSSEFKVPSSESGPTRNPEPGTQNFWSLLPSIVQESDQLVAQLLTNTTDLSADELDSLDYGDVLALLEAALEVNLDDEIKNSCAGVVARIRAFYAATPAQPKTPNSTP